MTSSDWLRCLRTHQKNTWSYTSTWDCAIISSIFNDQLKYQHETQSIITQLEYDQSISSTVLHMLDHILEYYILPIQALHLHLSAHASSGVLCSFNTAILEYYHIVLSTVHLVLIYTLEHCSPSAPYLHLEHCIYTRVSMRNLECYNQFSSITILSRALCNTVLCASPQAYQYTPVF